MDQVSVANAKAPSNGKPVKLHKSESIKESSEYLRGTIADELRQEETETFSGAGATILKFHGVYCQDDRDLRSQRRKQGRDKAHSVMVRTRIPGGKLTAEQYLIHDRLAQQLGNQTMRITTRQGFQLHGVPKRDLHEVISSINRSLLSTLAACGDVQRNVLCCPAPIQDGVRVAMQEDVDRVAAHFAPRGESYWDIWVDGEKLGNDALPQPGPSLVPTVNDDPVEPIYGTTYLPRKFKTAFALPEDNCTDILSNDLGYLAIVEQGKLVGYDVTVGGGLGVTPSAAKTFRRLADRLCFATREEILPVGEAVLKVQRDWGNRSDRKRARLKYLIHDLGIDAFRTRVEDYLGRSLTPPRDLPITGIDDHLGWHEQGDGRLFLGLPIENGRIADVGNRSIASGLRTLFERFGMSARLTCLQSLLLINLDPSWKPEIEAILVDHGIPTVDQVSTTRRWAMACPALPTCGLAVTESERVLPGLLDELEQSLQAIGVNGQPFTLRMTGCPNGCARPYISDIGLVGRSAGKLDQPHGTYTIYLGGRPEGDRLNQIYKDYVPFESIVPELTQLMKHYQDHRQESESFGTYCDRIGVEALAQITN